MAQTQSYRTRFQDATKSEKYGTRFERGSRQRIDRREQNTVRQILLGLAGCRTVLDMPCGAGRFLATLLDQNRHVIEADVAVEMLSVAQRRLRTLGQLAYFVQADAANLPFVDGAVDCVFCNRLLHHILSLEDRAMFLREMCRVSRRYVVMSFFDYHLFGWLRRSLKTLKGRKPQYRDQPTRQQFFHHVEQCGFHVRGVVPMGPVWVAEKYFVLEKV